HSARDERRRKSRKETWTDTSTTAVRAETGATPMANDRQQVLEELKHLRERDARADRLWWRALWAVTVAVFILLWALYFRGGAGVPGQAQGPGVSGPGPWVRRFRAERGRPGNAARRPPASVLVGIVLVHGRHGHADRLEYVQNVKGVLVGLQHFLQAAVDPRRFVGPAAPQLDAQPLHLAQDVIHGNGAAYPHPLAFDPAPAPGGLGAAHDAARTVHGAVEGQARDLGILAPHHHGDVPHAAADEAQLARMARGGAFAHDDNLFAVVLFLPGEVVMVVHLKGRPGAQDGQHLVDDHVPPRVGVAARQLHRGVVGLAQLRVHAQTGRRVVHGFAARGREIGRAHV